MAAIIIPAIIPTSAQDLENKLLRLQGIAPNVQVDIVDGKYAGPASWPYLSHTSEDLLTPLQYLGTLHIEMDLMVADALPEMFRWVEQGANRIVLHAESALMLDRLLAEIRTRYGHDAAFAPGLLSIGLAIGTNTDLALIEPYLDRVDYVQFMGIARIGKQGEPFDEGVLPRIRAFTKNHPNTQVQVDGGVSIHTAPALLSAGVSRLIVGSALWNAPHLETAYAEFIDLTTRYGLYT